MRRPARVRRILAFVARALLLFLSALIALVVASVLALDTRPVKSLVASQTSTLLRKPFKGAVSIERIGSLGLWGASGIRARVFDPEGRQVVYGDGLSARIDLVRLLWSLVSSGPVVVRLTDCRAAFADVSVDEGGASIARAFEPKVIAGAAPSRPGPGVRVAIERARIARGWAHGRLGGVTLDADVVDAGAGLDVRPEQVHLSVSRSQVSTRAMPVGANLAGSADFDATFASDRPLAMHGDFSGAVGGARTTATARLQDGIVQARVQSEGTPVLQDSFPLARQLLIRAEATGPFASLDVRVHANAGPSALEAEAVASLTPVVRVNGTFLAKHVNLRRLVPGAPRSDIDLAGQGSFELDSDVPRGRVVVEADPSVVSGIRLPRVSAIGVLRGGAATATVLAEDSRGKARAELALRQSPHGVELDFDAAVHVPDLTRATGSIAGGQGDVFAKGTFDLTRPDVRGRTLVAGRDLSFQGVRVDRVYLSSTVAGDPEAPEFDGAFTLDRIEVGARRFRSVSGRWSGAARASSFEALLEGESKAPTITARGDLSIGSGVTVQNASITGHRAGASVLLGISKIRIASRELRLEHAAVLGLGRPVKASARVTRQRAELSATAPRIDLRRLARIVGLDPMRFRGEGGADIDVRATPDEVTGHVDLDLHKASLGRETRGAGRLQADFSGRRVAVLARTRWNGGKVDLRSEGFEIGGSPLRWESWARARGAVDLSSDVDLKRLAALLPRDVLPFEDLEGRAGVRVHVERPASNVAPSIALRVRTHGLAVSRKGRTLEPADAMTVRSASSWHLRGVDVDADVLVDPGNDRTDLRAELFDSHGALATVSFDSTALPPGLLARPADLLPHFERTPAHVTLAVPKRRLADLPPPLARSGVNGSVEIHAEARGRLAARPEIEATVAFEGLSSGGGPSFDALAEARYADDEASVSGSVKSAGRSVATADVRGHVAFADIVEGDVRRFDVKADAFIDRFPLHSLPRLAAERVGGRLSGTVNAAIGTDIAPLLEAKLDASDVTVGSAHGNHVTLSVDADRDTLRADARVEQIDGSADLRATVPIRFPFAPPGERPPTSRAAQIALSARHFRLAALRPAVQRVVSGLDGRIDGNAAVTVSDGGSQASMSGALRLTDGAIEIPTLGNEFSGIAANVKLSGGDAVVDDLRAEGTSGRFSGSAAFHFSGYEIDRATANVKIPKRDPIPVSFGGEALADAWGNFDAKFSREGQRAPEIRIEASKAGVRLPRRSSHALQSLEPAERVRIGIMREPEHLEVLRETPEAPTTPSKVQGPTVTIVAKDVEVRRGTDLRVRLDAEPVVTAEGVQGAITLRSGYLIVQGKKFEIEKGVITFHGEADNPEVVVTAGYAAPEDTRVYADFVGPLKTGKLTLRSDPPHTQSEILSLILFGTSTGNAAPSTGGGGTGQASASAAAGIGGSFASQGLNRAIDDLTGLDVTAGVDTSQSANPRPEVEMRVSRDVTVSIAHVLGVPPPGTNPDRNLAKIDLRLFRNWSLQTTFGDQGSSLLDLVWQYRY